MREAIALAEAADSSQCGGNEAVAKRESVFRSWSTRNPDQSQDNGSDAHAAPRYDTKQYRHAHMPQAGHGVAVVDRCFGVDTGSLVMRSPLLFSSADEFTLLK